MNCLPRSKDGKDGKVRDAACQVLFLDDERGFASEEELMYCQSVCVYEKGEVLTQGATNGIHHSCLRHSHTLPAEEGTRRTFLLA